MITLKPKEGVELLAIEVPVSAIADGIEIRGRTNKNNLLSFYGNYDAMVLPNGDWEIIGTTNERESLLIDFMERKVTDGGIRVWKDYRDDDNHCFTPRVSFYSLLMANGIDLDKKIYAILKKL